ncbi:Uncharacterized protein HZ326_27753 [Fusarium oxysporum f. sp. albedinis]|nr:Uncharacterized protein HZ326_27753 [Fusarium oxysporum f. sp. albedinis]
MYDMDWTAETRTRRSPHFSVCVPQHATALSTAENLAFRSRYGYRCRRISLEFLPDYMESPTCTPMIDHMFFTAFDKSLNLVDLTWNDESFRRQR